MKTNQLNNNAKIHNYSLLETRIKKIAFSIYALKSFASEWIFAIFFIFLLLIFSMAVSIYASFEYVFQLINNISSNGAFVFTIVSLVLIESLNNIFLNKFFKFLFRFKNYYKNVIILFVVISIFFSISFHLSTHGLAVRQANKSDETIILTESKNTSVTEINNRYDNYIIDIKNNIETIKQNPAGWVGGSRKVITQEQQKDISKLNTQIIELLKDKKIELSEIKTEHKTGIAENNIKIKNVAKQYYSVMAIIMLMQFFANGFLTFCAGSIAKENDSDFQINELITVADVGVQALFRDRLSLHFNEFKSILSMHAQHGTLSNGYTTVYDERIPTETTVTNVPIVPRETINTVIIKEGVRYCLHCNAHLISKNPRAKYCSNDCKWSAWKLRNNQN